MRAFLAALMLCACAYSARAESGIASVYWEGTHTANGERLCTSCLTAAHRALPFNTLVKVCRIGGNCIVVRINDRGPARWTHCIIDLTPAGAKALGFSARGAGHARVTVEPLGWSRRSAAKAGWTPQHGAFGGF